MMLVIFQALPRQLLSYTSKRPQQDTGTFFGLCMKGWQQRFRALLLARFKYSLPQNRSASNV